jgi:tetratricopeptide (TPR) repeat protein
MTTIRRTNLCAISTIYAIGIGVAIGIASPSVGQAQTPTDDSTTMVKAKAHYRKAEGAYRLGEFRNALGEYKKALRLVRRPSLLLNVAQCHRHLDEFDKALFFYKLYLDEWARAEPDTPSPYEAEVKKRIKELEKERQKQKEQATAQAQVLAEQKARKAQADRQNAETRKRQKQAASERRVRAKEAQRSRRKKTLWGYTTLGTGLAAAVATGILLGTGISSQANGYSSYREATTLGEMEERWEHEVAPAQKLIIAGYAAGAVSAVLLGVATYLLVSRPEEPRPANKSAATSARLQLRLAPSSAGFSIGGHF